MYTTIQVKIGQEFKITFSTLLPKQNPDWTTSNCNIQYLTASKVIKYFTDTVAKQSSFGLLLVI